MQPRKQHGFTLIELLVVIAIIAVLAAILFPVFAQVRDKARSASCLSNTKQIGTAIMMYVQDHDEGMPPFFITTKFGPTYWHVHLKPYVKNLQVFICPSAGDCDPNTVSRKVADATRQSGISTFRGYGGPRKLFDPDLNPVPAWSIGSGSYGWNACFVSNFSWDGKVFKEGAINTWLYQISDPVDTILIGEISKFINPGGFYLPPTATWAIGLKNTPPFTCSYPNQKTLDDWWVNAGLRHQGGMHVIFFDGHAKWTHEDTMVKRPELFVTSGVAGR